MFPVRYFAPRYFAPRFWPNVGADVAIVLIDAFVCLLAEYSVMTDLGAEHQEFSDVGAEHQEFADLGAEVTGCQ